MMRTRGTPPFMEKLSGKDGIEWDHENGMTIDGMIEWDDHFGVKN